MAELLFEIWREGSEDGGSMMRVHPQNDKARALALPDAVLMHSFTARSAFEAFRHNNAWHGYSPWEPGEHREDHVFTEEEAAEQRAYLAIRGDQAV